MTEEQHTKIDDCLKVVNANHDDTLKEMNDSYDDLVARLIYEAQYNGPLYGEAAEALEARAKRIYYLECVVDCLRDRLGSAVNRADHFSKRLTLMEKLVEKIIKKAKSAKLEKFSKKVEAMLDDYYDN